METKDESRLLALPLELVTRITDNLNDESLPTLRLTCKTLEGATFARFSKTFQVLHCCMYYESRWLSLKNFLNSSTRLVDAVRYIAFTTDPLEGRDHTLMQLAPGEDFADIRDAQRQFDIKEAREDDIYEPAYADRQPSSFLIHSVLLDISDLAPGVPIAFDLTNTRFFRDEGVVMHKAILFAIASTSCYVGELAISRHCFEDTEDLVALFSTRLLSCTSSMHSFSFQSTDYFDDDLGESLDEANLTTMINFLENAECLVSLQLELHEYHHEQQALTERFLFANNLANLESLYLHGTKISEKQLCDAIRTCRPKLKSLAIGGIQLMEVDAGWSGVMQLFSTLPALEALSLGGLTTCEAICTYRGPHVDFSKVKHGEKVKSHYKKFDLYRETQINLEPRDVVVAGLKGLLSGPLSLTDPLPL